MFFCNLQNLQNERNPWFIEDFEQNRKAIPLRIWIWGTEKYTLHFRNPNAVSSSTERKSFILDDFGAKNTKSFVHASETFLNKTRFLTKFKGFWRVLIQADPNLINILKSDQNVYFLKHFRESLNYVERFVFCQKWEPSSHLMGIGNIESPYHISRNRPIISGKILVFRAVCWSVPPINPEWKPLYCVFKNRVPFWSSSKRYEFFGTQKGQL